MFYDGAQLCSIYNLDMDEEEYEKIFMSDEKAKPRLHS